MSIVDDIKVVRGACPHDSPDTCAMLVTVENRKATKVRGDPQHPFTQGGLCVKVNDYPNHATARTGCCSHCGETVRRAPGISSPSPGMRRSTR